MKKLPVVVAIACLFFSACSSNSSDPDAPLTINELWYIGFSCSIDQKPESFYDCSVVAKDKKFNADCNSPRLLTMWGDWDGTDSAGHWITHGVTGDEETYRLTIAGDTLTGTWSRAPEYIGECDGGLLDGAPTQS